MFVIDNFVDKIFDLFWDKSKEEIKGIYKEKHFKEFIEKYHAKYFENVSLDEEFDFERVSQYLFDNIDGRLKLIIFSENQEQEKSDFNRDMTGAFGKNAVKYCTDFLAEFERWIKNNISKETLWQLAQINNNTNKRTAELNENMQEGFSSIMKQLYEITPNSPEIKLQNQPNLRPTVEENVYIYRNELTKEIRNKFVSGQNVVFLYSKIGGLGKSELAREYAETYRNEYDSIQLVTFEGDSLKNTITHLIFDGFNFEETNVNEIYKKYCQLLSQNCNTSKNLIIIDNYNFTNNLKENKEIIKWFKDNLNIHILFTQRKELNNRTDCIEVPKLSKDDLFNLFVKINSYTTVDEIKKAKIYEIIEITEQLTLAVVLVAGMLEFAEEDGEKTIDDFIDCLKNAKVDELEFPVEYNGEEMKNAFYHIKALYNFGQLNNLQAYVMQNACLLPTSGMNEKIFKQWIDYNHSFNEENINDTERSAYFYNLVKSGWVKKDDSHLISLHPLIKEVTLHEYKITSDLCKNFINSLLAEIKEQTKSINYTKAFPYIGIAMATADFFIEQNEHTKLKEPKEYTELVARLFHYVGYFIDNFAYFDDAIKYNTNSIKILEFINDENNVPNLATTYNNLGSVYKAKGEIDKAIEYYNKALEIFEKVLPENHPDLAKTYGNLGSVYKDKGEIDKAIEYLEKALEIFEKVLPANHPDLATTYNNLGLVYKAKGEIDKAIEYLEKALEIFEKVLPANHPDLATTYNNLGLVYKAKGEIDKAIEYYNKALEISKKVLPANHPDLATTYNNLGLVYKAKGEIDKAIEYYNKALEIRKKVLPANHPDLATTYNNLGSVYQAKGEIDKAIEYLEKALEIRKKVLPANHPDLATTYNNLGLVYHDKGEIDKAIEYYNKALEISKKVLPENHPSLATTYNNLGSVYKAKGEIDKAIEYYNKALEIRKKVLPANHPDLATTYNNLGLVYYKDKGDFKKAIKLLEKALRINKISLPPTHPYTKSIYNSIISVYMDMKDIENAKKYYNEMQELCKDDTLS